MRRGTVKSSVPRGVGIRYGLFPGGAVFPDGRWLAVPGVGPDGAASGLVVVEIASRQARFIPADSAPGAVKFALAWSPDSTTVYFGVAGNTRLESFALGDETSKLLPGELPQFSSIAVVPRR
jgi:hypothetical protein